MDLRSIHSRSPNPDQWLMNPVKSEEQTPKSEKIEKNIKQKLN
jgi:hypothetical protein